MDELSVIALLALLLDFLFVTFFAHRADRSPVVWLVGIVGVFGAGELLLLAGLIPWGAVLFVIGGLLFAWWSFQKHPEPEQTTVAPARVRLALSVLLVVALLGLAAGLRLWRIGDVPYGIEQDEMSWTVAAAYVTYTDFVEVEQAGIQADFVPISSLQERIFFDLFGMKIESARLEVALFSSLAVLLFYLLVVQITNRPTALFATFFLAISTLHIASARLANVESHVLFWVVLSYLLFWLAVRNRSLILFFATGISVVLGLWTYDTYNMTAAVIGLAFAVFAAGDLRRWRFHALSLGLFLLPIALMAEKHLSYLDSRRTYTFRNVDLVKDSMGGPMWEQALEWARYFGDNLAVLLKNLFVAQTNQDYQFLLVRPDGPVLLAALLPLAGLGFLLTLRAPRRPENFFVLTWLFIQLLLVPVVLGTEYGRILLPGLLAVMILAGSGAWFLLQHVMAVARGARLFEVLGATVLLGLTLAAIGINVYFAEARDPEDNRQRRDLIEAVATQRDTGATVVVPITPGQGDYLSSRAFHIRFALGRPEDLKEEENRVQFVRFEELPGMIASLSSRGKDGVVLLLEHRSPDPRILGIPQVEAVRRCHKLDPIRIGVYFDIFQVESASLLKPGC